jgi:hypothetical protein
VQVATEDEEDVVLEVVEECVVTVDVLSVVCVVLVPEVDFVDKIVDIDVDLTLDVEVDEVEVAVVEPPVIVPLA